MSALDSLPAVLSAVVETETAFGGRLRAWTPVATVWVALRISGPHAEAGGERPPQASESATATARDHPAADPGQQLSVDGGAPWRVRAVRHAEPAPGAMTLVLDRLL